MLHRRFARPFALVLFTVPALVACGGKAISLGTSDKMTSASSKQLTAVTAGDAGSCPSGWVHPNICCSGDSQASCGEWASNPLRACDSGDTTYPDPLSCCSLSDPDPKDCINTPADAGSAPTPPPSFGCGFSACPPGWWSQGAEVTSGNSESQACCTLQGNITVCEAQSSASTVGVAPPIGCLPPVIGTVDASVADGGPAPTADGGTIGPVPDASVPTDASFDDGGYPTEDAGAPYDDGGPIDEDAYPYDDGGSFLCTDDAGYPSYDAGYPGYDGGAASLCAPCPAGWTASSLQPEVCCTTTPSGVNECFSQATGSAYGIGGPSVDAGVEDGGPTGVTFEDDAGPSTGVSTGVSSGPNWSGTGSAGETCSGSAGLCSCEQTTGGHTYALDCYAASNGAPSCSCSVDGTASGTTTIATCSTPGNIMSAFSATSGCGF